MKYSYPIIEGKEIAFEELKLARAKKIALAVLSHPYCLTDSVKFISKSDEAEIIIVTFDNEIPENPLNGIQVFEDVAMICKQKDANYPEIFALREDFIGGLTHTNVQEFEHPVSLCVTEQLFEEERHRFNEFEFIELIRSWFSLTAEGKLHQVDQPLESFFRSDGYIVAPQNQQPEKFNFLQKVGDTELYYLSKKHSGETPYAILRFSSDAQVHGFIRKEPKTISDLDDVIVLQGVPFSEALVKFLDENLSKFTLLDAFYSCKLAFYCIIPVLRYPDDEEPSSYKSLCFLSDKSFTEIGLESKCIGEFQGNYSHLLSTKFKLDIIKNIEIKTYTPLLDFTPETAAFFNNSEFSEKNILLIGAGALGSQVLTAFSRIGFGRWTVIDHDFLLPHNLAKHALGRKSIGFNKAVKMAEEVNELLGSEFASPVNKSFNAFLEQQELLSKIQKFDNIIDMSTSIAVARKLARDLDSQTGKPRTSAFLNPTGTDLVVLSEDKERKHRLDLLEMQYYRCLIEKEELHKHLQITQDEKVRYNRNSCREITNRINQTNVAIHASICVKALKQAFEKGNSCLSIWNIDEITYEVKRLDFKPSDWEMIYVNGWKICVDNWLIEKIQNYRLNVLPHETGGILIGSIDADRKILYLIDTIFAPVDSIERRTSFIRGTKGLLDKYQQYQKITDNQVMYMGEWHSHPENCSTNPSKLDEKLFSYLAQSLGWQGYPAVMCILGDENMNMQISFNDERDS